MANPEWRAAYGGAWDAIAEAEKKAATARKNSFRILDSQFATLASRHRAVRRRDQEARRRAAARATMTRSWNPSSSASSLRPRSTRPWRSRASTAALELALAELGPNDAFVKAALNGRSPKDAAAAMVNGTKMADPAYPQAAGGWRRGGG